LGRARQAGCFESRITLPKAVGSPERPRRIIGSTRTDSACNDCFVRHRMGPLARRLAEANHGKGKPMRTLKLLSFVAVALLIAASANAGIILTVRFADNGDVDPDYEFEVDIRLVNQDGTGGVGTAGINILQFSWDYTGTPVGPGPVGQPCNSSAPQSGCDWGSPDTMVFLGSQGSNANGVVWLWSADSDGPSSANATFTDIALFTLAAGSTDR